VKDGVIAGETVFRLYDTYGFPVDLTGDIARERGLSLDMDGFNEAMAKQRTRAREASQFEMQHVERLNVPHKTEFTGYDYLEQPAEIVGLYRDNQMVDNLKIGDKGFVVLKETPFYAESGGQVGDKGFLESPRGVFEVLNTRKMNNAHLHEGIVRKGELSLRENILAKVDTDKRQRTALNHSATHLLHAALRRIVGEHVQQKGSLVEPERLRFDFSHFAPLKPEEIRAVEELVNAEVRRNTEVKTDIMAVEDALHGGAMALFGEKYGDKVRVLTMGGDFSVELCGGTHINRTGDIGLFKIIYEGGISAGVRRLEAVTGRDAFQWIQKLQMELEGVASLLKTNKEGVSEKLEQALSKTRQLERDLQQTKLSLAKGEGNGQDLSEKARDIAGVKVLSLEVPVFELKTLREMADHLKKKLKRSVVVLGGVSEQKVNLVCGVTPDCVDKIDATALIKHIAEQVGGQGGGRKDMASAGGTQPEALKKALESVYTWVESRVK